MTKVDVILRKTPGEQPCWQFYSTPISIVGGGSTVDEATERFLAALADECEGVAEVARHVETPAPQDGFYVRMFMSDDNFSDRENRIVGVNEISGALGILPPGEIDRFNSAQAASGDVVVIVAQPSDTMGWLFDQMNPFDSVWLGFNAGDSVEFVAIHGGRAADRDPDGTPIDPDEVRDRTIPSVLGAFMSRDVERAGQLMLA